MTPAANTLSALLLGALVAPAGAGATTSRVIVSGLPDAGVQVATAVDEAGGQILRPLGVIDGVVAEVPRDRLDEVRRSVGVRGVVPDGTVTVSSAHDGFVAQDWAGSLPVVADVVGADRFWAQGHHGAGVDVALIDTGVSEVPGLDAGQVLHGPDLSFDSQDPSTIHVDTYGHGTHMAGIIAGRDAGAALPSAVDDDHFLGVAPAARLVSVKIGDRNGIVVVAAAGNGGHRARLSSPAYSPHVLAVGATDSMATRTTTDDEIPTWSSVRSAPQPRRRRPRAFDRQRPHAGVLRCAPPPRVGGHPDARARQWDLAGSCRRVGRRSPADRPAPRHHTGRRQGAADGHRRLGQQAQFLERLEQQAQRLDRLLSDLLDLDRLNRGEIEPRRRLVDLVPVAQRAVSTLDIQHHDIRVDADTLVAEVDPALTERILENLVRNAVKYSPAGTLVTIGLQRVGDSVFIRVEDEGQGIPEHLRTTILDPFVRVDHEHPQPGTGIGLTLVRRFAQLHDGDVWIEDGRNGGTRVVVVLQDMSVPEQGQRHLLPS